MPRVTVWSLSAAFLYVLIIVYFIPNVFLLHHFVYRNANKIRDSRNEKYIGIANLAFPLGYGLGTHSQKFSKLTLCKPVGDIFRLWDTVEREFPQMVKNTKHHYGVKKYSKYNNGEVVGQTMFAQSDIKYLVPKGIVYPVVGAFRALISVDPQTGFYSWKKNPSRFGQHWVSVSL